MADNSVLEYVKDREDPPMYLSGESDKERRRRLGTAVGRSKGRVFTILRDGVYVTIQLQQEPYSANKKAWKLEILETTPA